MNRRRFLKYGLAGAFAAAVGARAGLTDVFAQTRGRAKKLVIAVAYGGWDPVFALDPKPDSPEVDWIAGAPRRFGNLPIWVDSSRPAVTQFFEQWSNQTAILNGVAVESLAHETCIDVVLTGSSGQGAPDLGARVARELGADLPLPYLALSPQAEIPGHEALTGMLGDTNQIMALANPEFAWPAPGGWTTDKGLSLNASEKALLDEFLASSASKLADEHGGSPRSSKLVQDYKSSKIRQRALFDAVDAGGLLTDANLFAEQSTPWKHVAAALAEGISQVALVQPNLYWDTHEYNYYQSDVYEEFFGGLGLLMSELTRHGIMEDTIVLVVSEMGRTPRHNTVGGKDHWLWTSAMLIGANVNGGRAVGQTDEWLRPTPIDLRTGAPSASGEVIHAGNVLATTARLLGIDNRDWFAKEGIDALIG